MLSALSANVTEPGFYFFPWGDRGGSKEQMDAWAEKYRTSPAGIMIFKPQGGEMMPPSMLITELVTNILAALIAAFLLSRALGGLAGFSERRSLWRSSAFSPEWKSICPIGTGTASRPATRCLTSCSTSSVGFWPGWRWRCFSKNRRLPRKWPKSLSRQEDKRGKRREALQKEIICPV